MKRADCASSKKRTVESNTSWRILRWRTGRSRTSWAESGEACSAKLAEQYPRHGYWRLYRKLRRAGVMVNHKCVYRLYREEGLKVTKRARKRVARTRVDLPRATRANQNWSTDFMSDSTADGRRLRVGNVVDDCTREAASHVDRSI